MRKYELTEERMKSHGSKQNDGNGGKYPKKDEKKKIIVKLRELDLGGELTLRK